MNGVYKLEADLTVDNWTPIGEFPGKPFTGILRGNNKTITINSFSEEGLAKQAVGLFGYTAFAEMENLAVKAELDTVTLTATGTASFGLVIGNSLNVNLKNINVFGKINKVESTGILAAGGMVGFLSSGKIETSQVEIEINGNNTNTSTAIYIGGITGYIFAYNTGSNIVPSAGAIISDCSFEGSIEGSTAGSFSYAGGIVGYGALSKTTTIKGCQVTGNIAASGGILYSVAGGIVGYGAGFGEQFFSIEDCSFDEGLVTAGSKAPYTYAGGIIGQALPTTFISRCVSAGDITASFDGTTSDGSFGVYAGGISGINQCSIQYCSASGHVQAHNAGTMNSGARNRTSAGGISGLNTGSITQCYATGDVESLFLGNTTSMGVSVMDYVAAGGITGLTGDTGGVSGTISDCYYDGDEISAEGSYAHAGGITGLVQGKKDDTRVSSSYARGVISAKGYSQFSATTTYQSHYVQKRNSAGGIAGLMPSGTATSGNIPTVENCVALTSALTVTGPKATEGGRAEDFYIKSGRIAGNNYGAASGSGYTAPSPEANYGILTNNTANSAMTITQVLTGESTVGPDAVSDDAENPENTLNGKGVSNPPAQTVYTDLGWDFAAVWKMGAAGYPVLAWQN
jgi:hypothetical protein